MNGVNKSNANNSGNAGVNNGNDLYCFVCDSVINDRFYTLSKCRTQRSKSRVIEKLGEILGEDYMIVVSDSDVICRSCANLVNTLDRLEMEMNTIQTVIHKFLKKKYTLNEDPSNIVRNPDLNSLLLNQSAEIATKSTTQSATASSSDANSNGKAVETNVNPKLKCESCPFTTTSNSIMVNHIRKNHFMINKKAQSSSTQTATKKPDEKANSSSTNMKKNDVIVIDVPMMLDVSSQEPVKNSDEAIHSQKKRKITRFLQMNEDGGLQIVHTNNANN